MFSAILLIHKIVVFVFIVFLTIKTFYLFRNRIESLAVFSQRIKLPNIIVSILMLATGLFLWYYSGAISMWFFVKMTAVILSIPLAVLAFRKNSRLLAVASILLLIYAYGVSETRSANFQKSPAGISIGESKDLSDGRSVYTAYCRSCHGEDGTLQLSGASKLTQSAMSLNQIIDIINNGSGTMPAYRNILSEEQVENVAKYVHQFQ